MKLLNNKNIHIVQLGYQNLIIFEKYKLKYYYIEVPHYHSSLNCFCQFAGLDIFLKGFTF